jgi:hypothetical protein
VLHNKTVLKKRERERKEIEMSVAIVITQVMGNSSQDKVWHIREKENSQSSQHKPKVLINYF